MAIFPFVEAEPIAHAIIIWHNAIVAVVEGGCGFGVLRQRIATLNGVALILVQLGVLVSALFPAALVVLEDINTTLAFIDRKDSSHPPNRMFRCGNGGRSRTGGSSSTRTKRVSD